MDTTNLKSSIGFAISLLSLLSTGVGAASTEVMHYSMSQVVPVKQVESRRTECQRILEEVSRANRRARHLAQIFQNECTRLSHLPDGVPVDHEAYEGLAEALRNQESALKRILAGMEHHEAEEFGFMDLRRNTAKARSAAASAAILAKQTTNKPEVVGGRASGKAMKALADSFDAEMAKRFS
ncbi:MULTISPECIES: hypothetical protein [unclassified Modicisalibacter]|uniref:hypothetical protein n=1 Tax=unclassified Modicisalibacter TaxID=2679913 RepID=UPI001CCA3413|nr:MULTISPECIES: hypothetical protein [unclassified Modicisalibacter]MBZ9558737.1 hypothetical protein [Modicisalibacter sp. R2A 31.J]MBZ9575372.1 hypothetical protein [Modicisalibacter sp. MOD 31.J]